MSLATKGHEGDVVKTAGKNISTAHVLGCAGLGLDPRSRDGDGMESWEM